AVLLEVADAGREPARGAGDGNVVGGAIVGDAIADLVDVADTGGGPADGGVLGVGGAVDARAVAVLPEVADAGRETAGRAGGGHVIGRTVVGDAVAAFCHVAETGRGPAHRRALRIVRARGARPGACLGDVADAGGRTTRGTAGDEAVGRTAVADAVAALGDVADASGGPADRRALGIIRARGARPGAGLRDVADAGRCPTYGAASRETVGGAGVAHAVTGFRHVTEAGRRPADRRALRVVRARGARPAAGLLDVADAGGRPTRGAAGGEGVGGAGVADAVAALGHVAQAGRGPADGGALRVRGTGRARPGALLRDIADAGGRATRRAARHEAVRGGAVAD